MWITIVAIVVWFVISIMYVFYRIQRDDGRDRWYDIMALAPMLALLKTLNFINRWR